MVVTSRAGDLMFNRGVGWYKSIMPFLPPSAGLRLYYSNTHIRCAIDGCNFMFKHVEHVRDVNGMWAMLSTLGASPQLESCLDSDVTLVEVKSTLCNAIKLIQP